MSILCCECNKPVTLGVDGDFLAENPNEFPMHTVCGDRLVEICQLEGAVNPLPIEEFASLARKIAERVGLSDDWVKKVLAERYP